MLVMNGQVDVLGQGRRADQGRRACPAGVGSHSLETPMACEKNKINPDFYVKTFHMDRYWSATPKEKREEWCWYKGAERRPRRLPRQHVLPRPEKTAAVHGDGREALGGVQGDGGRRDPPADRPSPTPSATGPTSSSPACSTSRSSRTRSSPSATCRSSAIVPGRGAANARTAKTGHFFPRAVYRAPASIPARRDFRLNRLIGREGLRYNAWTQPPRPSANRSHVRSQPGFAAKNPLCRGTTPG